MMDFPQLAVGIVGIDSFCVAQSFFLPFRGICCIT